jgi:transposase
MGIHKRRLAPRVVCSVNRDLESLTIRLVTRSVRALPPPWKPEERGRRPHDPRLVTVCCILMVFLGKTYDGIESYVKGSSELKRLFPGRKMPGHSVIDRGMGKLSLPYIRKVTKLVVAKYRRHGITVAVDSSGFPLSSSSKYFDIRVKRVNTRKDFLKLHVCMDVETGLVLSFVITGGTGADSKQLRKLLRYLPRIARCLGDPAYSSRKNCEIVVEKGGKPYLKFKATATGRAKGSLAWKESFRAYNEDNGAWMAVYHLRSLVESLFGSIKRRWGDFLRSRRGWTRRKELALKVLCYDVKQALYLERAAEVGTALWITA